MAKYGPAPRPLAERFFEKVCPEPNSGCWLWTAASMKAGYGVIGVGGRSGRQVGAHRVAWELAHGPIPPGMLVCHRCDTPACVNVAHMFLGTVKDNADDMMAKCRGRNACFFGDENISRRCPELRQGERHGRSKLTDDAVRSIRRRRAAGETAASLAVEFGVKKAAIWKAASGFAWKHLPM